MNDIKSQNQVDSQSTSDMAIVVVSYDGYSDLWDDYFNLLNKYWADRPYPVYLANNVKQPRYHNVSVINCGADAQWSTRTRMAVEQIKHPYICLLLEDYFTGDKVVNKDVAEALELIQRDGLKYYKLNNFSKVKAKHYKNMEHLYTIPENLEYGISLQAAIWDRNFLLKHIGNKDYSAWKFEVDRIKEAEVASKKLIQGCVFDCRNILNICHGVSKGKYLKSAIKYFEHQNYHLNITQRAVMTRQEYMAFCIKGLGKQIIPTKARKKVKNILSKFGMEFVS